MCNFTQDKRDEKGGKIADEKDRRKVRQSASEIEKTVKNSEKLLQKKFFISTTK